MKAITAYYLCRKHKLINERMTFRDFKYMRKVFDAKDYTAFIKGIMLAMYFDPNTKLPEEGIRVYEIPPVRPGYKWGLQIGGTLTLNLQR